MVSHFNSNDTEAVRIAKRLAIPCKSKGKGFVQMDRLYAIDEELKGCAYTWQIKKPLFWMYAQKPIEELRGEILIVSSHADSLQDNPLFSEDQETGMMRGIFDNAITNAACVFLMQHGELPENVVFVFTGEEENDSRGAKEVCKYLANMGKKFKAISLDVTCEGWKKNADFSLENDFIYKEDSAWIERILYMLSHLGMSWDFIAADPGNKIDNSDEYVPSEKLTKWMSSDVPVYKGARLKYGDEDEAMEYDECEEFHVSCFSFCLPCGAKDIVKMHSQKGFTIRKMSYFNYIKALYLLCLEAV